MLATPKFVQIRAGIADNFMTDIHIDEGHPYGFVECLPNFFPVKGVATAVKPGDVIEYQHPDMFNRPWAQIWEQYFEQGMQKPEEKDIFEFE